MRRVISGSVVPVEHYERINNNPYNIYSSTPKLMTISLLRLPSPMPSGRIVQVVLQKGHFIRRFGTLDTFRLLTGL